MTDPDLDLGRLVARLRAAGCVFAEEEAALLRATGPVGIEGRVQRRIDGEPLEQVVGWAEFAGLRVIVEPGVFVPRRRSELLVAEALARLQSGQIAVDLCCGSGAIGAAIAAGRPGVEVYAADLDPRALSCARRNLGADRVFGGDLFDALPDRLRGRVDVLAVNAPYVPTAEIEFMPREARLYEPSASLDGGVDGLDWHRQIAAGAPAWLGPGGTVLIETSVRQAPGTRSILESAGLEVEIVHSAELDATVAAGRAS